MDVVIESFAAVAMAGNLPGEQAAAWLPDGYTLTGGGAYDLGGGATNVLSSCYPVRDGDGVYKGWAASGREPFPLAVYAIGIKVTRGGRPVPVEQQVFCATSAMVGEPGVSARLGAGWIGTGGGARDNCAGPGAVNVLTSSYPLIGRDGKISGWGATGRDLADTGQARLTAFVIGIRGTEGVEFDARIIRNASMMTGFPSVHVRAPAGNAVMAGGGALRGTPGQELLLSASCPVVDREDGRLTGWFASRKIARAAAPGALTAYGVMLQAGRGSAAGKRI
ncbi:hypothetical protein [Massilia sp. CF038]|uniref:hypothetical protein n=1 Tax=Massilia sp. CF038 TaxID=1881045 RepID=UPI0009194108|nr:hypothetical protein [Massilia sp. CF038]SHG97494.1 hypothetical protein SAMN05428948_2135 [Massilia sp. CF038]